MRRAQGWFDQCASLVDIGVKVGEDDGRDLQGQAPAKPPGADLGQDVVLRDIGWDLG